MNVKIRSGCFNNLTGRYFPFYSIYAAPVRKGRNRKEKDLISCKNKDYI